MTEKIIVKDIQKLDPGSALVQLFELEYIKDSFAYFTSGIDDDVSTSLRMRDFTTNSTVRTYTPIPVNADGFELKNDGAIARPTITMAKPTRITIGATEILCALNISGLNTFGSLEPPPDISINPINNVTAPPIKNM